MYNVCTYMFYSLFESLRDFPNFVLKSPRPGELSFLFLKIQCHSIFCLQCHEIFNQLLKRFQNRKSHVHYCKSTTPRTREFFFRYGCFNILKLLLWVCKHTQVPFPLIVPLKSVRSLQCFSKVSALSCMTPTSCLRSQRLFLLTQCPHSR